MIANSIKKNTPITIHSVRDYLRNELVRRCRTNKKYSLRAFAKFLKIDPSYLSKIIHGSRPLSIKSLALISKAFNWSSEDEKILIEELQLIQRRSSGYEYLESDRLRLVADWYHYGILELIDTDSFQPSLPWIAHVLGISEAKIKQAIKRLIRLDLLTINSDGRYSRNVDRIVNSDLPIEAFKTHQLQVLKLVSDAVKNIPVDLKCNATSIFSIDSKKIISAKKKIYKFQDEISKYLHVNSAVKDDVYVLSLALVPVTQMKSGLPQSSRHTEKLLAPKKKNNL